MNDIQLVIASILATAGGLRLDGYKEDAANLEMLAERADDLLNAYELITARAALCVNNPDEVNVKLLKSAIVAMNKLKEQK